MGTVRAARLLEQTGVSPTRSVHGLGPTSALACSPSPRRRSPGLDRSRIHQPRNKYT
ncbi:hypothetical protein [Streptomyces sp. NPDC001139]